MIDIAPGLLEKLQESFNEKFNNNAQIEKSLSIISAGEPTYMNVNDLSIAVGDVLAEVFQENLSSDILPDGKMYYNIAKRTIEPMMIKNYDIVTNNATLVQELLNEQVGLGIKAQIPRLNQSRIDGIINKLDEAEQFDDVKWVLDEPIKNFTQAVADDTVKKNAQFHKGLGLEPKLVRKVESGACDWCNALGGEYNYSEAPNDIYRRHRYCRCTVEYIPIDGRRKNVWNKKWRDPEKDAKIEIRKQLGTRAKPNVKERILRDANYRDRRKLTVERIRTELDGVYTDEYNKILTKTDKKNVYDYQIKTFTPYNRHLRGVGNPLNDAEQEGLGSLIETIKKSKTKEDIIVSRGTTTNILKDMNWDDLAAGDIIEEKGFMSVSAREEIAKKFAKKKKDRGILMDLQMEKGTSALFVDTAVDYTWESEFILQPGSKIEVLEKWEEKGLKRIKGVIINE